MGRRAQQRRDGRRIRKPADDGRPRQGWQGVDDRGAWIDRRRRPGAQGRRGQKSRCALYRGRRRLRCVQRVSSAIRAWFAGPVAGQACKIACALRWCRLRSEEHTSELQSHVNLVCRLLLEKKKKKNYIFNIFKKKKK